MKPPYNEADVIDFGRQAVDRFADVLLERATAGLPPDAVLSCRAIQRIIEEERAKWLKRHPAKYPELPKKVPRQRGPA
jgi:hypothetical protein